MQQNDKPHRDSIPQPAGQWTPETLPTPSPCWAQVRRVAAPGVPDRPSQAGAAVGGRRSLPTSPCCPAGANTGEPALAAGHQRSLPAKTRVSADQEGVNWGFRGTSVSDPVSAVFPPRQPWQAGSLGGHLVYLPASTGAPLTAGTGEPHQTLRTREKSLALPAALRPRVSFICPWRKRAGFPQCLR